MNVRKPYSRPVLEALDVNETRAGIDIGVSVPPIIGVGIHIGLFS